MEFRGYSAPIRDFLLYFTLFFAIVQVSSVDGQDCEEEDYEQFANSFSIHIMWKIVNHLFVKIHM